MAHTPQEEPGERQVGWPKRLALTSYVSDYPQPLVEYADFIVSSAGSVIKNRHGVCEILATDADRRTCKTLDPGEAKILVDEAAWRGLLPAEGTRRSIILEAVKRGDVLSDTEALEIADSVESALLRAALGDEAMVRGAEALTDGIVEVDPEANRMGRSVAGEEAAKALNHLIIARRECVDPAELARLNEAITAAHMVIEPPSFTAVAEAVRKEVGEEPPTDDEAPDDRQLLRTQSERIGELEGRCDQLLEQREQAYAGEGVFKAQRDGALYLLRWLIGDIIPPDLISVDSEERG